MSGLKKVDWWLLSELRRDARRSLSGIGRSLGMPISTAHDKVKGRVGSAVKRYTCLLDFERLGFNCRAVLVLRVREVDAERLRQFLLRSQNVNSVYKINNGYSLLVEVAFKGIRECEAFLEYLEKHFRIPGKQVFYVLEDFAREQFLADRVHSDLALAQLAVTAAV